MDDRAYHLQFRAHIAVGAAIRTGKLKRQPCEKCGDPTSQAHHDSYYPDKWLKVRWLCPKDHKAWHEENEPEWPTIYEFHPSDDPIRESPPRTGWHVGRCGRVPSPWLRKSDKRWYAEVNGRQRCLGKNYEEAKKRLAAIVEAEGA